MARTRAQRQQERSEENRRYWVLFRPKLAAVETYEQALALALDSPAEGQPGRLFHSNLRFVLETSNVPRESSTDERELFRAMLQRFVQSGQLTVEKLHRYEGSLKTALPAKILPY